MEPESATRLLPTISVRSGETPSRPQAVRERLRLGLGDAQVHPGDSRTVELATSAVGIHAALQVRAISV